MKSFCTIALFVSALSVNVFGQKKVSTPEWEISFGRSSGRYLQDIVRHTIDSKGRITYLDKQNSKPSVGQISGQNVAEITGLLNRLNLPAAKAIPSTDFNKCIVSPHLPNIYFSLKQNKNEYSLSHCNNSDRGKYEYTLNLSANQKAIYERLRLKLESLFDDEIKKTSGVRGEFDRVNSGCVSLDQSGTFTRSNSSFHSIKLNKNRHRMWNVPHFW